MFTVRQTGAFHRLFPNIGFKIITEPGSLEDSPCLERDKLSNRPDKGLTFPGDGKVYLDISFRAKTPAPSCSRWRVRGMRAARMPVTFRHLFLDRHIGRVLRSGSKMSVQWFIPTGQGSGRPRVTWTTVRRGRLFRRTSGTAVSRCHSRCRRATAGGGPSRRGIP